MLDSLNKEISNMTDEQLATFLLNHSETFKRAAEDEIVE